MAKMNHWRANKICGRQTLDYRYENDVPDRAQKWINAVERRQREKILRRRDAGTSVPTSRSTVSLSTGWSTVADSAGVPW
jgi:hypothetical protein